MENEFLYREIDGLIFNTAPVNLTIRELKHISDGEWIRMEKPADLVEDINKRHCHVVDGAVVIKPYTEWPEYEELIEG